MIFLFNFQAVFEAVVEGDGDVALDDITLTPGCVIADSHSEFKFFQSHFSNQ